MISLQGVRSALAALRSRSDGAELLDVPALDEARYSIILANMASAVPPPGNVARWSARIAAPNPGAGNRAAISIAAGPWGSWIVVMEVSNVCGWFVSAVPVITVAPTSSTAFQTSGPSPLAQLVQGGMASGLANNAEHPRLISSSLALVPGPAHPPIYVPPNRRLVLYQLSEGQTLNSSVDGSDLPPG